VTNTNERTGRTDDKLASQPAAKQAGLNADVNRNRNRNRQIVRYVVLASVPSLRVHPAAAAVDSARLPAPRLTWLALFLHRRARAVTH